MSTLRLFADPPSSLYHALERAGRKYPGSSFGLLDNRGRLNDRRSFAELYQAAAETAARFRTLGLDPDDRVLICLPTSWQWLDSWFGAALCGALPVALAPPGAIGSPAAQVRRGLSIGSGIGARYLVSTEAFLQEARAQEEETAQQRTETRLLDVAELESTPPKTTSGPSLEPDPEDIAFLQLTSGSTGLPRAVQISHRAAVHNAIASSEGISGPHGTLSGLMVSWLPLYHDLGLVGCVLNCLVNGFDCHLMRPRSFLARPWIWLQAISRGRDVVAPAPNFAYQLCADRLRGRDLSDLDLSAWRDAMTGSEVVRPETMDAFAATLDGTGFEPQRVRPCYGLAEATLAVTFDNRLQGVRTRPVPEEARVPGLSEVVSIGDPIRDTRLEIRSEDGEVCGAGVLGEVWIRGPGVFSGYHDDEAATREGLRDGWLDTGDLGFLDEDGELYLTGRSKEILILHGLNVMPHDIEWVAESAIGGGGGQRSGAFSVPSAEGEKPVLVVEVTTRDPETLESIRRQVAVAVGRETSIPLADVVLVKRGTVPRTSSGKVKRRALRDRYLSQRLKRLDPSA